MFCFFCFFDACACLVKVRVTKPAQASKKQKKTLSIYSGLGVYRSQKFCFFCFFDACAGFVKIMLCFFCFFLMPVHVW